MGEDEMICQYGATKINQLEILAAGPDSATIDGKAIPFRDTKGCILQLTKLQALLPAQNQW